MRRNVKSKFALLLALALFACILTGCSGESAKAPALEPFAVNWGATAKETSDLLKCVYRTNVNKQNTIYVLGEDNSSLQAFGTTPSLIIYSFESASSGLDKIFIYFPKSDYNKVLADLDAKCGTRYYDSAIWGIKDAEISLHKDGVICMIYNAEPIGDPGKKSEDELSRANALVGQMHSSNGKLAEYALDSYNLLYQYSTADKDFIVTDNAG